MALTQSQMSTLPKYKFIKSGPVFDHVKYVEVSSLAESVKYQAKASQQGQQPKHNRPNALQSKACRDAVVISAGPSSQQLTLQKVKMGVTSRLLTQPHRSR